MACGAGPPSSRCSASETAGNATAGCVTPEAGAVDGSTALDEAACGAHSTTVAAALGATAVICEVECTAGGAAEATLAAASMRHRACMRLRGGGGQIWVHSLRVTVVRLQIQKELATLMALGTPTMV